MDYIVNGGNRLRGELPVYGAKNCALALLGATLLTDDAVTLFNCPIIDDVENMLKLLASLGKKVVRTRDAVTVQGGATSTTVPSALAGLLRGSGLVLGSAVGRYHQAFLPTTGGCAIGKRPIDIHLDGLRAMGVSVREDFSGVTCEGSPVGCKYDLRFPSVGATENLLCAATLARGETVLAGCALEPEVVALQKMLLRMGADIDGVGSSVLRVRGVKDLHGAEMEVIPDRIVACTYLACGVSCGGKISVTHCIPTHFDAFLRTLTPFFDTKVYADRVELAADLLPKSYGNTVTAPYPAFPTDVQQILMSLCASSDGGVSTITEQLFENRLAHNAAQLGKMGGRVEISGNVATVTGHKLHGAEVSAKDLRGGAGLVVAALGASGQTTIHDAHHICRGYSNLAENLQSVGADISVR